MWQLVVNLRHWQTFSKYFIFTTNNLKVSFVFYLGLLSFLPLPLASQTLGHELGDYCRELISAHSQQPYLNREPMVSERVLLTTKLRAQITHLKVSGITTVNYEELVKH